MINLLLFADKTKIFGYDLTDRTSPSELSFEGNDSVSFENDTAVKDCIQCIKDKYSVDDLSDDDFDIAVIDCGTKKKYIPEIVNAVQKSRKIGVYSLNKLIVPALINMSKQPEDTIYVSLGDSAYKVYSLDGVYYTDKAKCDEPDIQLSISDLSFVFNFNKPEAAAQTGADPSQIAELNSEIAKLNNKISESEQTIVALRNENAAITEKEAEKPQELPADEYVDNAELKTKLKEIMNADFPLDDYIVDSKIIDDTLAMTIIHTSTNFSMSFSINKTNDETTALRMVKSALINLSDQVKLAVSPYASLEIGDTFEFGRYNDKTILWRVLDKENGYLTVISDDIICNRSIDSSYENLGSNCELNQWLNTIFYKKAFSSNEKEFIHSEIYLISKEKVSLLFDDIKSRVAKSGAYWLSDVYQHYTYHSSDYDGHYVICPDGESAISTYNEILGVRPCFTFVYDKSLYEKNKQLEEITADK